MNSPLSEHKLITKPLIQLDILRHGQTELTCQQVAILRGHLDDSLTNLGWQQMQQIFDRHRQQANWQLIISSPLQRCADFAVQQAEQQQLPLLLLDDWKEMNFGDWEGQSTQHLYDCYPDDLARFWQTPSQFTPPNAESLHDFEQRIQRALWAVYEYCRSHDVQRVCVISHGGVIKLLKCLALRYPLDDILKQTAELGQMQHFQMEIQQHELILQCR